MHTQNYNKNNNNNKNCISIHCINFIHIFRRCRWSFSLCLFSYFSRSLSLTPYLSRSLFSYLSRSLVLSLFLFLSPLTLKVCYICQSTVEMPNKNSLFIHVRVCIEMVLGKFKNKKGNERKMKKKEKKIENKWNFFKSSSLFIQYRSFSLCLLLPLSLSLSIPLFLLLFLSPSLSLSLSLSILAKRQNQVNSDATKTQISCVVENDFECAWKWWYVKYNFKNVCWPEHRTEDPLFKWHFNLYKIYQLFVQATNRKRGVCCPHLALLFIPIHTVFVSAFVFCCCCWFR